MHIYYGTIVFLVLDSEGAANSVFFLQILNQPITFRIVLFSLTVKEIIGTLY